MEERIPTPKSYLEAQNYGDMPRSPELPPSASPSKEPSGGQNMTTNQLGFHQQNQNEDNQCPVCGKVYSTSSNMWRHHDEVHLGKKKKDRKNEDKKKK